jgi:hypothetical protein
MATTYTYGNDPVISSSATSAQKRDAIRFLTQDNQANASSQFQLTDEEIAFVITQEANIYMAAARSCDILANRAGAVRMRTVGALSVEFSREDYKELANSYRARGMTYQVPSVGGISRSDKDTLTQDTDWLPPLFSRRMQENPGATTDLEPVNDRSLNQ